MFIGRTRHAVERSAQRGVPLLVQAWLLDYGEQAFNGRGAVIRYFTRRSIRRMERDFGAAPLKRLSEFMRCYLVESSSDGAIITVGKRYRGKRIWHR